MATEQFGLLCYATPSNGNDSESSDYKLPEIHLNIWEQEKSDKGDDEAFLDIGLMLNIREPAKTIEIIFPWEVKNSELNDLSSAIATPDAIPAIFNESWAVNSHGNDHVVYDPLELSPSFALISIDGALNIKTLITRVGGKEKTVHSISIDVHQLKIKTRAAETATGRRGINKFYIRFRVQNIKKDFYCVGAGNGQFDDISAVVQQKTEDIDFRLNVRRGAPPNLAKELGKFVEFSKVHLFLMRSRDKDLVFQGKKFNASRSLEDEEFWARYSLIEDNEIAKKKNRERVKRSLGYQWKDMGDANCSVKEFGILARFRIVRLAMRRFVVYALLLGVLGNLIPDVFKWAVAKKNPESPIEAVCVKAGENFILPKQSCPPSITGVTPSRVRVEGQAQIKKE